MTTELVFVYNADSGTVNALIDAAHKAVSPGTYGCSLCRLTHGVVGEKTEWRAFVEGLGVKATFLHRDEATTRFGDAVSGVDWPAVLRVNPRTPTAAPLPRLWIDKPGLDACVTFEALQALVRRRLNRKPVLGLSGAPGSGKSTAAALLADRGGAVIDADALAHASFDEPAVRDAIRDAFGDGVFHDDGRPDRKALAALVFDNPDAKARLEAIVHPRVAAGRERLHERFADDPAVRFVVEDCPLLIETALHDACDFVLLVDAPRDVRQQRLAASRGWDDAELTRREQNQLPFEQRRPHADAVLDNTGDRNDLATQIDAALQQFGLLAVHEP